MAKHCTHCGALHRSHAWPKTCPACGETTWKNPAPVAVLLQPIEPGGLLVIRRGIEPQRGCLALPGGYVDWEESWRAAAARELMEETGLETEAAAIRLFDVASPPDGRKLIIIGLAPPRAGDGLPPFAVTSETTERRVITGPLPLAFPIHTAAVEAFFAGGASRGGTL